MTPTRMRRRPLGELAGVIAVVLATAATWWGWLGWDDEYQVDPVTGQVSGPYEAWQVIGCVLGLIAIVVVGVLTLRPWLAPLALTGTFSGLWSWWAGNHDESGLWLVGAVLVVGGLAWGSAVVSVFTWLASKGLGTGPRRA
ncbi:hypothetical protein [Cryptosporangium phraense]|uniref:Uncharacterized protein n=1 Tax=Cryptosporangium phraense TaxID=2593070 RepID=A0A545ANW4_9ACTN|nr:hypothetical protein [Cryptosporangium phraense]TQS43024.1 hypothetical protein FL583_21555 [Cryptosporangium phraense]